MRPLSLMTLTVLVLAPFFFLCYEIARALGWPESFVTTFEPWMPLIVVLLTTLAALFVPSIGSFFSDPDHRP